MSQSLMNIFNPALMARAFLYFTYPVDISGDKVWALAPDGYSGPTALSIAAGQTNADAVDGPILDLYRNDGANSSDADDIGAIVWSANNDASEKTNFGRIMMKPNDVSNGTEDGYDSGSFPFFTT